MRVSQVHLGDVTLLNVDEMWMEGMRVERRGSDDGVESE